MATKQQTPRFGLAIDWETSGAVWGSDSSKEYQGLSFGAVVFNTSDFSPVEELYRVIKFKPDTYKWSAEAQAIHGMSKELLEEQGVSQEDAAVDLAELILKYWGAASKVMLLGHNVEFDRRFTNQLLNSIEIEFSVEKETQLPSWIQLHHVVLDTAALGFCTLGIFKSDLLFERIGFDARGAHNALDDIRMTLHSAATIKQLINLALSTG
jgi:DNA polymerase III epsilon subunit-like protein